LNYLLVVILYHFMINTAKSCES